MSSVKKYKVVIVISAVLVLGALIGIMFLNRPSDQQPTVGDKKSVQNSIDNETATPAPARDEEYQGKITSVAGVYDIKVPNGWKASISTNRTFLALMFARPNQLESLLYNKEGTAEIDQNGIPAWGGLTEHFYVRSMTATSQNFQPSNHSEVITEQFTFQDGTIGTKYLVTKHASEAKKYGGLLKDNEWYGRVYVYEKDNSRIEAHLAFYPSTRIDEKFYEQVAKTISLE